MKTTTIEIESKKVILPRVMGLKKKTGISVKRLNTLLIMHGIKAAEKDASILTTINAELLTVKQ